MEPMLSVKISLVSEAGYWRLRAIKFAQFGEQILRGGRRRINVGSEPELAPLSKIIAIRSRSGVGEGRGAMRFCGESYARPNVLLTSAACSNKQRSEGSSVALAC
jgi:hypothetical protein